MQLDFYRGFDLIRRCGDTFPKGEGRERVRAPNLPLWGRWLSEAKSDEVVFPLLLQPFNFLLHHFLRAEVQRGEAPFQRLFQLCNRRCLVACFQIIA